MTTTAIAEQIAGLIGQQADAIAGADFARLEALTTETARLMQSLDAQAGSLRPDERAAVAAILQPAVERANGLVETATDSLGQTRRELHGLRHGQTATSAYRQAVPKEAAISYSRQG